MVQDGVRGDLALSYVGTLHERTGTRLEDLDGPERLVAWLGRAGVVDSVPQIPDTGLRDAIAVREAVYRAVGALVGGTSPSSDDVSLLNAVAAEPPPVPQLSSDGQVVWTGSLAAALSAVARDALCLWDLAGAGVLKWCDDQSCTQPFVDRSRGHRRRWCGMANCGNRAKARAYRHRRREDART